MRSPIANTSSSAQPAPVRRRPLFGAYYLNANMYCSVPAHLRADMEWMADKGTNFVCVSVLESDVWAAKENIAIIIREAARVGMRVLAVPARWAGLTAGAPKVPSLFSALHPKTWLHDERGRTGVEPKICGVISSVHWPETLEFFQQTLSALYAQHPELAGCIIDEPKAFRVDHSPKAQQVLGRDAPRQAHIRAAADFYERVCAFAKREFPDKQTLLFTEASHPDDELQACVGMKHLDYVGLDGRPWDLETDRQWSSQGSQQESGKGKVLLSGKGERVCDWARIEGKKSFLLIENHNLDEQMKEAVIRQLPEVFALNADLFLYYYFPRNVPEPTAMMEDIGAEIRRVTGGATAELAQLVSGR